MISFIAASTFYLYVLYSNISNMLLLISSGESCSKFILYAHTENISLQQGGEAGNILFIENKLQTQYSIYIYEYTFSHC